MSKQDVAAIQALLQTQYEAWARGDADAYGAVFTPEAEYVAFDGSLAQGRQAIVESHRPLFAGFLKGSRLVSEWQRIRFLTPDVAVVHVLGGTVLKDGAKPAKGRRSINTTVAVRTAEGWRFAAFQNTRYRPWTSTLLGKLLQFVDRKSQRK